MMDVQVMRELVDVIEEGKMPDVAREAARCWYGDVCAETLVYVRSSANHIFRFEHSGAPYYLRLAPAHERQNRQKAATEAELDFIAHVASTGVHVALPVPSAAGALIEEVSSDGQHYFAVVFEGLRGRELEVDGLDEAKYRAWGQALARIHHASQTFPPHPARPNWRDELHTLRSTLPPEETAAAQVLASGLAWLDSLAIPPEQYGLLHGDSELDNLVWDGERVQALDFDGAAYTWYAVDIAAALQDVWDLGETDREPRLTWFIEGYASARPAPAELPKALPRLMTLLAAEKVARLLRSYAAAPAENDPAWLATMRARHTRWLAAKRAALAWP